ncbi:hypothetical protein B0H14DRAFT_2603715 [Mycena olivaceomarginata]|nr:hypothetical protein B0H14DRAFT_2603715 [Mycena olivaceomarginata]
MRKGTWKAQKVICFNATRIQPKETLIGLIVDYFGSLRARFYERRVSDILDHIRYLDPYFEVWDEFDRQELIVEFLVLEYGENIIEYLLTREGEAIIGGGGRCGTQESVFFHTLFLFLPALSWELDHLYPAAMVNRDLTCGFLRLMQRIGRRERPTRLWRMLAHGKYSCEWGRNIRSSPKPDPDLLQKLDHFVPLWDVFSDDKCPPLNLWNSTMRFNDIPNPQPDFIDSFELSDGLKPQVFSSPSKSPPLFTRQTPSFKFSSGKNTKRKHPVVEAKEGTGDAEAMVDEARTNPSHNDGVEKMWTSLELQCIFQ